jgi:pyruvate/2-oxoglutarate dehydrogenase complex dihydrolipoamide acyltransferase (E2) component
MAHVKFASNYDHRWPSGAETAYRAGWSGNVKVEVAEAAKAAGVLADDAMPNDRPGLEKLAADEGVDLAAIEGTGARGHVKNEDIAAAILAARAPDTLAHNLPAELAEPSALNPALHEGSNSA